MKAGASRASGNRRRQNVEAFAISGGGRLKPKVSVEDVQSMSSAQTTPSSSPSRRNDTWHLLRRELEY